MARNITLSLDDDLIRKVRVIAAKRGTSVSALLRSELGRLVSEDEAFEAARQSALRRLRSGARLKSGRLPSREELHDRAKLR